MYSYKNFTQAMLDNGYKLSMRETRGGYARNQATGGLFALSITKSSNESIDMQTFSDDGRYLIAEMKHRGPYNKAMHEASINTRIKIFTGGEHAESVVVKQRVRAGSGWTITPINKIKMVEGSVYQGEYVLREMTPVADKPGYFLQTFERV